MSGRPLTTIASADGRFPAASALWNPDGALLPRPPAPSGFHSSKRTFGTPLGHSFTALEPASRPIAAAVV